ncbi:putative oxidoreductase [Hyphodiscus hymeniophilus]|uniref:Oxidoreductase n=1 Tax=Hyphodiscus hymeniophilus TaxID=353542 RepID=A0A9P7B183_9HELO|nr:putative oxidoreductase [Hyphodiscus hymeniophilus]
MKQLTWLITGCSSGFGEAFVHEILARGDRVIATGRNASERLKHLEGTGAAILEIDVTASQAELDSKVKEALEIYYGIDVLVNNAGYFELGLLEEVRQMNTNLFGPMNMTKAILPYFRQRKEGKLVFIGSVNGFQGATASGPYTASKFALEELSSFGIQSIIFEPGGFQTKLLSSSKVESAGTAQDEYQQFFAVVQEAIQSRNGWQPGNIQKGVQRMVDVIRSEGYAAGRPLPKRLPLGSESLNIIKEKCFEILRICNDWEDLIVSTDSEEVPGKKRKFDGAL